MAQSRTNLKDEKTSLTRDRIMLGLAEQLADTGPHEVSIQAVADRAGVSHRTVYRYFGTKDELFQAYGEWLDERLGTGESTMPESLPHLAEQIRDVYGRFDAHAEIVNAYVRMGTPGEEVDVQRRRTEKFVEIVADAAGGVDEKHVRALAAILRQMGSAQAWFRARSTVGADGEALGEAAQWVFGLVSDAIEAGEIPKQWKQVTDQGEEE